MRTTHTLILRLLVDSNHSGRLRGVIHDVASGEEQSFVNEQELLAQLYTLLQRWSGTFSENRAKGDKERQADDP